MYCKSTAALQTFMVIVNQKDTKKKMKSVLSERFPPNTVQPLWLGCQPLSLCGLDWEVVETGLKSREAAEHLREILIKAVFTLSRCQPCTRACVSTMTWQTPSVLTCAQSHTTLHKHSSPCWLEKKKKKTTADISKHQRKQIYRDVDIQIT